MRVFYGPSAVTVSAKVDKYIDRTPRLDLAASSDFLDPFSRHMGAQKLYSRPRARISSIGSEDDEEKEAYAKFARLSLNVKVGPASSMKDRMRASMLAQSIKEETDGGEIPDEESVNVEQSNT